ncbi:MAG: ATP-dependent DNA helicase RecG, partial [Terriglobales bacterium]
VKGVGPKVAQILASRGIFTVDDLVTTLPFRYEDRSRRQNVRELRLGEAAVVIAQVQSFGFSRTRSGMTRLEMAVSDGTGMLRCVWFHADYLRERFQSGQTLALYGKLEQEKGRLALHQPEFEVLEGGTAGGHEHIESLKLGRIVPVYEAIAGLGSARLRRLVHAALAALPQELPDPLPPEVRQRLHLPDRRTALEQVHFPAHAVALEQLQAARTPGHQRLILEELFFLQAGLELKRRKWQRQRGAAMAIRNGIREQIKQLLPFHPTAGQKQVLSEIAADMCSGRPMRRLLQGDVGSGKTIVALEAAVIAIENGYQVALMAPTQILAEQHYLYARERLPQYHVKLVTGGRREAEGAMQPHLVIGTHALLEGGARFTRLGLVIMDEQHRFGVLQRFHLMHKESAGDWVAHVLVMTATPIPRSLALTIYGDLDASFLRESPPGARPITTRVIAEARSGEVYEFVRKRIATGRQAFFVYPIIEESETLTLKPALVMFARLQKLYPEFRIGLLHGRLPAEEKNAVMTDFRQGRLQALVATTVIEVGVDVPNATIMVIEQAERFGMAQLHQLRGRVGRPIPRGSARESAYCFLVHGEGETDSARQRLQALARTRDGFALAELDLKLRGPGEFFGTRQSGVPVLQIAEPVRDRELMERAREEARRYLDQAGADEMRELIARIQQHWQRHYGLAEVG